MYGAKFRPSREIRRRPVHAIRNRTGRPAIRVLVCPTAFKGSMGAEETARAMGAGVRRALPAAEVRKVPLSDGGPGLLESLAAGGTDRGEVLRAPVDDPLGRTVEGRILLTAPDGLSGVAESADACGLHLLAPAERQPLVTGTEGVGDLVRFAAGRGLRELVLGLGGSATCDGGVGASRRLGWRFLDDRGDPLPRGGGALHRLETVEPPGPGDGVPEGDLPEIVALADVRNPLLGLRGAARTFAPQKGAHPDGVTKLEADLERLAALSPRPEVRDSAGAGAAGGLAFGCAAFLDARIVPGASWTMERVGFPEQLAWAEMVVTGEGAFDATSGMGKVTGEVLRRARRGGLTAVLACGRIEGSPPDDVIAADGEGEELDAGGLSALTARLVAMAVGG